METYGDDWFPMHYRYECCGAWWEDGCQCEVGPDQGAQEAGREGAGYWRQNERNERHMQDNRTREFWARVSPPDDPYLRED